jgi:outer membrane lipoprotein SlyB
VEPVSTITNTAALGGIVATAITLGLGKERETAYIMRGTVAGAAIGFCRLLVEGLWC